jgi:hypothetical protein
MGLEDIWVSEGDVDIQVHILSIWAWGSGGHVDA